MLEFEGLDTVSTVLVNNQVVGNTDNMFVKYYFDITEAVMVSNIYCFCNMPLNVIPKLFHLMIMRSVTCCNPDLVYLLSCFTSVGIFLKKTVMACSIL